MNKKQLPSKREIIPASPESAAKSRATFTDAFKRDAVARLRAGNQSATDLAVELGLRRNQLYKWTKKLDEAIIGRSFAFGKAGLVLPFRHGLCCNSCFFTSRVPAR